MRSSRFSMMTADEAAARIPDGATVAFSGFTAAGTAKAVPLALAERAKGLRARGRPFGVRVLTGASTGPQVDDALARAGAVLWRAPYQSSRPLRASINEGAVEFLDIHLSHVPQMVASGFLPEIDVAVVEAVELTEDGRLYLSTSVGATPTFVRNAGQVIVELNRYHSPSLATLHDIAVIPCVPVRQPISLTSPLGRIGVPFVQVDPGRILGVVETYAPDSIPAFDAPDAVSRRIAGHVVEFLEAEMRMSRIPPEFLPLQAGVGNVTNAVMAGLGESDLPPFSMFTEVCQDSVLDLMAGGRVTGVSTCGLTLTDPQMERFYAGFDEFAPRIVLRPIEISNHPELIRRLGVIAINTPLEVDLYGHANSTHVGGTQLMNGIGGSGDFVRNAHLSILVTPSTAKGGRISAVVPMVAHVDHTEHDVQVIATEHGLADLRGLGPRQRAESIIERCADPRYRPYLRHYLEQTGPGHIRHDLGRCFEMHRNLAEHGSMLPDLLGEEAPQR